MHLTKILFLKKILIRLDVHKKYIGSILHKKYETLLFVVSY